MKTKNIMVRGNHNFRQEFLLECWQAFKEGYVPHPTSSEYAAHQVGNYGLAVTLVKFDEDEAQPEVVRDTSVAIEVSEEDNIPSPEQLVRDKELAELAEKLNDRSLQKDEIRAIAAEFNIEISEDVKYPAQMRKILREQLLNSDETSEDSE